LRSEAERPSFANSPQTIEQLHKARRWKRAIERIGIHIRENHPRSRCAAAEEVERGINRSDVRVVCDTFPDEMRAPADAEQAFRLKASSRSD
jgi:hypothetical protein